MKLKTINFIKSHKHWKDLLQASPYCLKIVEDNNYYMLRYNQLESDFSKQICNECRGLVIDKFSLEPIALSFYRFYNYGQQEAAQINWSSARVQEKIDGSKILIFYDKYDKKWQICTSGNLNAYDCEVNGLGISFGELLEKALKNNNLTINEFLDMLMPEYCFTFELVSPENRVIVPYEKADLYFIGARDRETWEEENPADFMPIYEYIKRPTVYNLNSLEECIAITDKMDYTEEGFVVVDKFWNRIKIKSKAYLKAHYCCSNHVVTPRRILDIILQGEKEEFLAYFPEYISQFENVEAIIEKWKADSKEAVKDVLSHKFETQKELAQFLFENYQDKSSLIFDFLESIDHYLDLYIRRMTTSEKQKYLGI